MVSWRRIAPFQRRHCLCNFEDKLKLAQYLGEITRRFHALPLENVPLFQPGWDAYINLLEGQRRQCKKDSPRLEYFTYPLD